MARWIVAGLAVLNVALVLAIYQRTELTARAEIGVPSRNVIAVAGQSSISGSVVYILDLDTGNLVALKNDVLNTRITPIAKRNVADDLQRIAK